MSEHRGYRKESRKDWGTSGPHALSLDQINAGAVLRIADACELMARRHLDLIDERDRFERWYRDEQRRREAADRRVSALRGVITKMKRKAATADSTATETAASLRARLDDWHNPNSKKE